MINRRSGRNIILLVGAFIMLSGCTQKEVDYSQNSELVESERNDSSMQTDYISTNKTDLANEVEENAQNEIQENVSQTELLLETNFEEDIQIVTPYCDLYYPGKWKEQVSFIEEQNSTKYILTAIGKMNDVEYPLFSLVFGDSTEMPIGTLQMEDKSLITIRLNLELFQIDDKMSDEEIETLTQMISDSNYTLEKLAELENFQ